MEDRTEEERLRRAVDMAMVAMKPFALSVVFAKMFFDVSWGVPISFGLFSLWAFLFMAVWFGSSFFVMVTGFLFPIAGVYGTIVVNSLAEAFSEHDEEDAHESDEKKTVVYAVDDQSMYAAIRSGHPWPFSVEDNKFFVAGVGRITPFDRKYLEQIWVGRANSESDWGLTKTEIARLTGLHRTGAKTGPIVSQIFSWLSTVGIIYENGALTPLGARTFPNGKALSHSRRQRQDTPRQAQDTQDTYDTEEIDEQNESGGEMLSDTE